MKTPKSLLLVLISAVTLLLFPGCGRGGDGGSLDSSGSTITTGVSGTLVDGDGGPVANALVSLGAESALTGPEGGFHLRFTAGPAVLSVVYSGVNVYTSSLLADTDAPVILGDLQVLSGVSGKLVDSDGQPVTDGTVDIFGPMNVSLVPAADGFFKAQLAQGNYTLQPNWKGQKAQAISFGLNLTMNQNVGNVPVLARVSGRFVDGLLQPIENAVVTIFSTPSVVANTASDGSFSIEVPTGSYRMLVLLGGMKLVDRVLEAGGDTSLDLGTQQVLVDVTGRLVDDLLQPVAGAEVVVQTTPLLIEYTQADGSFSVSLPLDIVQLCVRLNSITVAQELLTVPDWVSQGIHGLPEIIAMPMKDTDFDSLGDAFEFAGWDIQVDEKGMGVATTRTVWSNPQRADTDGDGLLDNEEVAYNTDPSRSDTDGDLLSDIEEVRQYLSNPANVDSDGDARALDSAGQPVGLPNPSFFDGPEAMTLLTSPTLDDTDGDGVRDREEVLEGGTSPLIADLPSISIEVFGQPVLGFVGDVSTMQQTIQTSAQNDTSASTSSSSFNLGAAASLDTEVKAQASYGFPGGFGGSVEGMATLKASVNTDYAYHTTAMSAADFNSNLSTLASSTQTYTAGMMEVAIKIQNDSDLAIQFTDLDIIVFQLSPQLGIAGLRPIGKLYEEASSSSGTSKGVLLGPQGSTVLLTKNEGLDLLRVADYMRNPTGLYFSLDNFSLLQIDENGQALVDYDVVAQNVVERTGFISIDWGDGNTDRYSIATNVERDPSDGSPLGLRMEDALNTLGLQFVTDVGTDQPNRPVSIPSKADIDMLINLDGVANQRSPKDSNLAIRYWVVLGPGTVDKFTNTTIDFREIRIKSGEGYLLQYVTDSDADGLTVQEERVLGTDDTLCDSDGDGMSDFEEVAIGWDVRFDGTDSIGDPLGEACNLTPGQVNVLGYHVFSNPRFGDVDGDGLDDSIESLGAFSSSTTSSTPTDPFLMDTDRDGVIDGLDRINSPCDAFDALTGGLVLHLDFSQSSYSAGVFLDQSSAGNDAINYATNTVRASITQGVEADGEGLAWAADATGLPNEGLHFVNDNDFLHSALRVLINNVGDGGDHAIPGFGGDACLLIDRSGPAAPRLESNQDGQGWTIAIRYSKDDTGTFGAGYLNGVRTNPLVHTTIRKTPVLLRLPNVFYIWDKATSRGSIQPSIFFESIGLGFGVSPTITNSFPLCVFRARYDSPSNVTIIDWWIDGVLTDSSTLPGPIVNNEPPGGVNATGMFLGRKLYDQGLSENSNWINTGSGTTGTSNGFCQGYDGVMDDLKIWDRPLTDLEITSLR